MLIPLLCLLGCLGALNAGPGEPRAQGEPAARDRPRSGAPSRGVLLAALALFLALCLALFLALRWGPGSRPGPPHEDSPLAQDGALAEPEPQAGSPLGRPPHLVVLMADDLGWPDLGFTGGVIHTPHIDRLAAQGLRLDALYVEPSCSPSRAALLTGRYPHRYGMAGQNVAVWAIAGLPMTERLLPELLRTVGYATAITGKWHLGLHTPEELPQARGFDHQYGHYSGMISYDTKLWRHRVLDWFRQGEPLIEPGYATDLIAAEACRVVRAHDPARPLFLYVPFNAPHGPYDMPPRHLERYTEHQNPCYARYAAKVTCMDDAVGRILAALDEQGLTENTLVAFFSDNGGIVQQGFFGNLPFRDGKFSAYEGGVRVPGVLSWPGVLPAGAIQRAPMHLVDLCATFLRLAGVPRGDWPELDGRDQWPVLFEGRRAPVPELLLAIGARSEAIRHGRWKLVRHRGSVELYDLRADPTELHEVSAEHPGILRGLLRRLETHGREAVPFVGRIEDDGSFELPDTWAPAPRTDEGSDSR